MTKILVADKLADAGLDLMKSTDGVTVDVKLGLSESELAGIVGGYDGMIVRSGVKVTATVLADAGKLRVVARAGVGVDNIDLDAATKAGVLVVNTPDANTLSTAELTMAMMLAASRKIPAANSHVRDGQWKRGDYVGTQLVGKTLGMIGFGRIGRAVAERALAFGLNIVAYDPFFSGDSALDGRVKMVKSLDEMIEQLDYLTVHATLTDDTRGIIGAAAFKKMKKTAIVVNCARGGIIDEQALADALTAGQIAGAAIDVYSSEPPKDNPLLEAPNIVLTPHLGASTREAQLAVSIDAVQAMLDYLQRDEIRSAVNVAGLPGSLSDRDRAGLDLVKRMGGILAQLCTEGVERITLTTHGTSLESMTSTLVRQAVIELLSPHFSTRLNMVNAMDFAKERGIAVECTSSSASDDLLDNVIVRVCARDCVQEIEGTMFADGLPRILAIGGYRMDMVPEGPMVLLFNDDEPGVIGLVGKTFGDQGVNIADMTLSRQNNRALMVFKCDEPVPAEAVQALTAQCPPIRMVKTVELDRVERHRPNGR